MAPAKGSKRAASSAKGSASSRQKVLSSPRVTPKYRVPKVDPLLDGVLNAIELAKDLPDGCRAMLTAIAPGVLTTPVPARHESQTLVVSWIEQVLKDVLRGMEEALNAANEAEADADAKKAVVDEQTASAKDALAAKEGALADAEERLGECKKAVADAKGRLTDALAKQRTGDSRPQEAETERRELEKGLSENINFLKTEEGFEVQQAQECINALWPAAKRLGLDESLVLALPAAAEKQPSSRGPFDRMVLEQLEGSLRAKVGELDQELKDAEGGRAERAAVVDAARDEVSAAEETQQTASSAMAAAAEDRRSAAAALAEAEAKAEAFARERGPSAEARDAKKTALENFKAYNMECFTMLRDKQVPHHSELAAASASSAPPGPAPATPAAAASK